MSELSIAIVAAVTLRYPKLILTTGCFWGSKKKKKKEKYNCLKKITNHSWRIFTFFYAHRHQLYLLFGGDQKSTVHLSDSEKVLGFSWLTI